MPKQNPPVCSAPRAYPRTHDALEPEGVRGQIRKLKLNKRPSLNEMVDREIREKACLLRQQRKLHLASGTTSFVELASATRALLVARPGSGLTVRQAARKSVCVSPCLCPLCACAGRSVAGRLPRAWVCVFFLSDTPEKQVRGCSSSDGDRLVEEKRCCPSQLPV